MTKRTDIHRPGAIVPADYTHWLHYSMSAMSDGVPVPPIRVDCAQPYHTYDAQGRSTGTVTPTCPDTGRCCVRSAESAARAAGLEVYGSIGKCGVCGAHFVYGSVFKHASGELVHMGHDCADKYELMHDMSAWELENGRVRRALATVLAREANAADRAAFLAAHPGLEQDLELGDPDGNKPARILADIRARFVTYRTLSDKQIALVAKLASEIRTPPADKPVERHAVAPIGKVEFEGEIVSAKSTEGFRGELVTKITVKVTTDDGSVWLAWGTLPSALRPPLWDASWDPRTVYVGRKVSVKATLVRPSPRDLSECETDDARERARQRNAETHFVIMQRPSACYADVVGCKYQMPKCIIGETCRVIRDWQGAPTVCDGHCGNVPRPRKARTRSASPAPTW